MQRLEELVGQFVQRADQVFVPREVWEARANAQEEKIDRLINNVDKLVEQLARQPSDREWETLHARLEAVETRVAQGQRFQLGALIQQNKTLLSVLGTAAVTLLGAFLYGHLRIQ